VGLIEGNNIYSQPITQFKPNTENKISFGNQARSRGPEFTLSKPDSPSNKVGSPPTNNGHTTLFPNSFPLKVKKPHTFPTL